MSEIVGPLSGALLHFLWQGCLIALALALTLRLIPATNVQLRYLSSVAALALMAIAPVLSMAWTVGGDAARPSPHPLSIASRATGAPASTTTGESRDAALVEPTIASPRSTERLRAGAVALWLIGVLVFTAINTGGWLQIRRLRRSGVPVADPAWEPWVEELRERLNIQRRISVLQSHAVDVPTLLGWVRPVVLIPTSAMLGMSPRLLEALLLHELAHVRRHDVLVNLLQAAVETLLFYHPAVWWVSQRVRDEREHCCDDLAVSRCDSRRDYVQALADMERLRLTTPRMAVAANGGSLVERIHRLTGSNTRRNGGSTRWTFGIWILVLFVTIGTVQLLSFPFANASPAPQSEADDPATPQTLADAGSSLEAIEGTWRAELRRGNAWLELSLDGRRRHRSSFTIPVSEFTGTGADGIPGFQLRRDAGTFYFEGKLDGRDRDGSFEFRGNPDYATRMRSIGFEISATEKRLYEMAAIDVSLAFAEGIRDAGSGDISTNRLVEFRIHGVTPEFIAEIADVGFEELSPSRLVEFRIHGVTPEFVREMEASGFEGLTASRLVEFRIHGVTPEFVREMESSGFEDLTASRLVEFRIHGVSAEFVQEMNALGLDDLSASRLVEFRIHGVTPEFVRSARSKYGNDLSARDLVEMRIHGWDRHDGA